jgi:hypothetical protein
MKIASTIPKRRVAAAEATVSRLYARSTEGLAPVSVFRLGGIMAAGRQAVLDGKTEEEVGAVIRAAAVEAAR